jgi:hypothetical protein
VLTKSSNVCQTYEVSFQGWILGNIQHSVPIVVHLTRDQENVLETSYCYAIQAALGLPSSTPNAVIYDLYGFTRLWYLRKANYAYTSSGKMLTAHDHLEYSKAL